MSKEDLPSLADVAAKFAPAPSHAPHAAADPSTGKGGTTSDPSLKEVAVEAPKEEVVAEVVAEVGAPKEEVKKDPTASRFAALARREKAAREIEQKASQRQKEIEDRLKAVEARETRFKAAKSPMALLKEHGHSYQDALQDFMGSYKEPEQDPVDKRLQPFKERWDKLEPGMEALRTEVAQLKSELTMKQQQESYNQAMTEIRTTAADAEKYELINAMGDDAIDLVRDTVVEYFNQHQKLLDYSEACDIVEKYYEEEYLTRLATTKKLQSRFPKAETSKQPASKEVKTSKQTLTQSLQTAPKATVNIDDLPKSEAIAYLAKKLQFKE